MRLILLKPFLCSARNRFFPRGRGFPGKTIGAGIFCVALCMVLYFVSLKVVGYFHRQNELGIILSLKIFQMSWIILFAMLIFSCMVTAVSTVFLSQDNEIIFAAPVTPPEMYFMRYLTNTIYTSWMMVVFSLPIFAAYGVVFRTDFYYWPLMIVTVLSTAAGATCFGLLLTVILVNLFPARRTKDIVLYLSLCFGIFIYLMIRLLRPEEMINPDNYSHFIDYLSSISKPAAPYVPAAWAANLLSLYLLDREVDWLLMGLLVTTPPALYFLGEWAMQRWFFSGYTKSQESFGGYRRFGRFSKYQPVPWRWIFKKETKIFVRDSAEWSQLFMIAALVVVYLYNFKLLPVKRSAFEEEYITNLISFLNIGLTGFIVTSLSARFVYPSIGAEGGAFYIIHSSPVSISRFLWYKYLFYVIPFTILSLFLVIVSDNLLNIEGPMWWFSVITSTIITLTVVAVALGFGSIYADFKAENRTAALGGMGTILFLLTALAFQMAIIFLGALPAYRLVIQWLHGINPRITDLVILGVWIMVSLLLAVGLALHFFRKGVTALEKSGN